MRGLILVGLMVQFMGCSDDKSSSESTDDEVASSTTQSDDSMGAETPEDDNDASGDENDADTATSNEDTASESTDATADDTDTASGPTEDTASGTPGEMDTGTSLDSDTSAMSEEDDSAGDDTESDEDSGTDTTDDATESTDATSTDTAGEGDETETAIDADEDGVLSDLDCDDADPELGDITYDKDCDGAVVIVDCDDEDPASTTKKGDPDCDGTIDDDDGDGIGRDLDCDDDDPELGDITYDKDCDGAVVIVDCDDGDPTSPTKVEDPECAGLLVPELGEPDADADSPDLPTGEVRDTCEFGYDGYIYEGFLDCSLTCIGRYHFYDEDFRRWGDGTCDDGTMETDLLRGVPIDFNCEDLLYDLNDCATSADDDTTVTEGDTGDSTESDDAADDTVGDSDADDASTDTGDDAAPPDLGDTGDADTGDLGSDTGTEDDAAEEEEAAKPEIGSPCIVDVDGDESTRDDIYLGFIDCGGNCIGNYHTSDGTYSYWGDGECDDGSYKDRLTGTLIDFSCAEWEYDRGDCLLDDGSTSPVVSCFFVYECYEGTDADAVRDWCKGVGTDRFSDEPCDTDSMSHMCTDMSASYLDFESDTALTYYGIHYYDTWATAGGYSLFEEQCIDSDAYDGTYTSLRDDVEIGDDCSFADTTAVYDCDLTCRTTTWLADGEYCDGDGDPDGHFDCLELAFDGGDCLSRDLCPTDEDAPDDLDGLLSCDEKLCINLAKLGNGTCDVDLACVDLGFDDGDCPVPGIGDECETDDGEVGILDCSGNCMPDTWLGDGTYCETVDDPDGHFDCLELAYDGGDCLSSDLCATDEDKPDVLDGLLSCDESACIDLAKLGDGTCDPELSCWATDFDRDDCADDRPEDTCEVDYSDYGAASCDSAWRDLGLTCGVLTDVYGWDCSGCACSVTCEDSAGDATDSYGDGCEWYDDNPGDCGSYDDDDFSASEMCCTCGGGTTSE